MVTLFFLMAVCMPALAEDESPVSTTQPATSSAPATMASEPEKPETVPLSFKDAPLDQIAKFLTEHMDKPVLIDKEVEKTKITVINPKPLLVEEAMFVLTTALHEQGVTIEERDRTVHLIPIAEVVRRQIDTVPADVDVATITPVNKIVRKIYQLKHYDPTKLIEVLKPLIPSYGHMLADPSTRKLIVVSPVERLITISRVIAELDEPDVSGGELRVFHIKHVDVYEVIPTLEKLIAGYLGISVQSVSSAGGGGDDQRRGEDRDRPRPDGGDRGKPVEAGAVTIKADKTPVLLVPEPRQSCIVVAAPSNVLTQIEIWLKTLDQPKPPSTQWEIVEVEFIDAQELAERLTSMLNQMPDAGFRSAVRIFPFASSRRIMIVGSDQNRDIVRKWMEEIDVADSGTRTTQTFTLEFADAQQVAENIKELFGDEDGGGYRRYYYYYSRGQESDRDKVTVTANVRQNTVTVVASPEKMTRIAEQIAEWDAPFEGDEAAPLIISLKYADPEKTKELLENLFTKKESGVQMPYWWYDDMPQETPTPVGRLFGQFRFEAYPDTGKLIVVSKNEQNYDVIKRMVAEIDRPQEAGIPRTIQLKFADAETVAEQLNALLNAPGTPTSILRRGRLEGFEQFSDDRSPYNQSAQPQNQANQPREQDESQAVMRFWWQEPADPNIKTRQPSNLVGKLRIVPNIERNLLLVAAPEEYAPAIENLVRELDRPGYQVLIKAVVAEVSLDDSMSLGFRFSTDPTLFTSGDDVITENALRGLFSYTFEDEHADGTHTFAFNTDINNLISLLSKVTDLSIKSEPKILTADNVEAEFFDGQDIPFLSGTRLTDAGNRDDTFDYFPVGITLRVRPHITEEKSINLTVKLRVSSVVPGRTLFGGAIVDRRETTTQIQLEDGRSFLISGILREEERQIVRKVPGLGEIPALGELFTHRETARVNTELLVFLTPFVIGPRPMPPASDPIEFNPQEQLKDHWPGILDSGPDPVSDAGVSRNADGVESLSPGRSDTNGG